MNKKLSPILGIKMPRSSSTASKSSAPAIRNPSHHSTPIPSRIEIEQPALSQSLKQGFGFGAGSAIAHRIFGATSTIQTVTTPSDKKVQLPCDNERTAFENCIKTKSIDDYCGNEQASYKQCLQLSVGNQ